MKALILCTFLLLAIFLRSQEVVYYTYHSEFGDHELPALSYQDPDEKMRDEIRRKIDSEISWKVTPEWADYPKNVSLSPEVIDRDLISIEAYYKIRRLVLLNQDYQFCNDKLIVRTDTAQLDGHEAPPSLLAEYNNDNWNSFDSPNKKWADAPVLYKTGGYFYFQSENGIILRYNAIKNVFDKEITLSNQVSGSQYCNNNIIVQSETSVSNCIDFSIVKFPGGIGSLVYDSNRKLYFEIQVLETRGTETKELIVPVTYTCSFTCLNSEAEKIYAKIKAAYKVYLNQNL